MALILTFRNITQLAPESDYEVEVLVGDGTREGSKLLHHGTAIGHVRSDGWETLVIDYMTKIMGIARIRQREIPCPPTTTSARSAGTTTRAVSPSPTATRRNSAEPSRPARKSGAGSVAASSSAKRAPRRSS